MSKNKSNPKPAQNPFGSNKFSGKPSKGFSGKNVIRKTGRGR